MQAGQNKRIARCACPSALPGVPCPHQYLGNMDMNTRYQILHALIVLGLFVFAPTFANAAVPAFPGAEGFGASSLGGKGGVVIMVTNLNDSGPGSLRAALTATGPRTVVFRTGGTITLKSAIKVSGASMSYLTVAGQTAPGGGIQIKGWGIVLTGGVHDVIIRYIKVRPGETGANDFWIDKVGIMLDGKGGYVGEPVLPVYNVIIDHCDLNYSPRDNFATYDYNYNISLQRTIIANAIEHDALYGGKGALIGMTAITNPQYNTKNISIHHNLFAHNHSRSPAIRTTGEVEVVNNVIYNWYTFGGEIDNNNGKGSATTQSNRANFIGNYYKDGHNTLAYRYEILINSDRPQGLYVSDNPIVA
jgi:pectate lyase